jgi:hypothetical protein
MGTTPTYAEKEKTSCVELCNRHVKSLLPPKLPLLFILAPLDLVFTTAPSHWLALVPHT